MRVNERARTRIRPRRTHQFVDDPEMRDDRTGQQYCLCGLPAENEIHTWSGRKEAK